MTEINKSKNIFRESTEKLFSEERKEIDSDEREVEEKVRNYFKEYMRKGEYLAAAEILMFLKNYFKIDVSKEEINMLFEELLKEESPGGAKSIYSKYKNKFDEREVEEKVRNYFDEYMKKGKYFKAAEVVVNFDIDVSKEEVNILFEKLLEKGNPWGARSIYLKYKNNFDEREVEEKVRNYFKEYMRKGEFEMASNLLESFKIDLSKEYLKILFEKLLEEEKFEKAWFIYLQYKNKFDEREVEEKVRNYFDEYMGLERYKKAAKILAIFKPNIYIPREDVKILFEALLKEESPGGAKSIYSKYKNKFDEREVEEKVRNYFDEYMKKGKYFKAAEVVVNFDIDVSKKDVNMLFERLLEEGYPDLAQFIYSKYKNKFDEREVEEKVRNYFDEYMKRGKILNAEAIISLFYSKL